MTAVGSTRVGAASAGGVLADLPLGRPSAAGNDGVFDALFARTIDSGDARTVLGERGMGEHTEPGRRETDRRAGGSETASSPRATGADRSATRDTAESTVGTDDEHDDEAVAVDGRPMPVPPPVMVRPEQALRGAVSSLGQSTTSTPAVAVPATAAMSGTTDTTVVSAPVPSTSTATVPAPAADGAGSTSNPAVPGAVTGGTGVQAVLLDTPVAVPVDAVPVEAGAGPLPATVAAALDAAASPAPTGDAMSSTLASSDAASTQVLVAGAPSDASAVAAQVPVDAVPVDGVPVDGVSVDGAPVDATPTGTGPMDAGAVDAGVVDASVSTDDLVRRATPTSGSDAAVPTVAVVGGDGGSRSSSTVGAAAPTAGADVLGGDPAQRLDDLRRVRERAALGGVGDSTMSVDLSDEGLGQLTLHALQRNGGLHLTLSAAEQSTRDLLLRQGDQLRSDLEAGGLTLGSLDINQSDARTAGGRDGSGRGESAARESALSGRVPTPAVATAVGPLRSRPSNDGLDLLI